VLSECPRICSFSVMLLSLLQLDIIFIIIIIVVISISLDITTRADDCVDNITLHYFTLHFDSLIVYMNNGPVVLLKMKRRVDIFNLIFVVMIMVMMMIMMMMMMMMMNCACIYYVFTHCCRSAALEALVGLHQFDVFPFNSPRLNE